MREDVEIETESLTGNESDEDLRKLVDERYLLLAIGKIGRKIAEKTWNVVETTLPESERAGKAKFIAQSIVEFARNVSAEERRELATELLARLKHERDAKRR
jgi:hypothetical protein